MPRSVNKVILIGTLGRDPEVRYMPNGNPVANLSLATDESYNDKQTGQKVEQTEWHRITVYGKLAEIVQQYLTKGSKVYFEGKLRTREWEKDGIKRYATEIIANDMVMLDSRQASGGQMQPGNAGGYMQQQGYAQQPQPQQQPAYQQHPATQGQGGGMQQPAAIAQPQQQSPHAQHQNTAPAPMPQNNFDDFDDDIPF